MSFKRTKDDVEQILKCNEQARADDMKLYAYYVRSKTDNLGLGQNYLIRVFVDDRFRICHGIAPYETVSRARRKIQAENPKLKPDLQTRVERRKKEKEYKEFFRKKRGNE